MLKKKLFTILGFKLVWLSCVLGEIYSNSLFGFILGIIFLLIFFTFTNEKVASIKIIFFFSFIGYCFDSLLSFFGLYRIDAQFNFLFLPLWFLVLWPCFCCLLIDVLVFIKNKKLSAMLLGAIFGPATYYIGVSNGLASVSNMSIFLLISLFWALMMFVYSKFF